MLKHFLSSLVFVVSALSLTAQEWDGTSVSVPVLTGTTYHIATGAELAWVAQQSKSDNFAGFTLVLDESIDLGEAHNWTPIGGSGLDFQGTFDGQCHTIKRLSVAFVPRTSDIGLFGAIGSQGVVKNVAVESGKIFVSEMSNVGSIAGRNDGTISHCFAMIQILADASNNVGGIVGLNNGTLTYCYQAGYIYDAGNNSGGLAGYNTGIVSKSYCSGYTMASGSNCGAVVGVNKGTFEDTFFDQQMCVQKASTKDEDGVIAVALTTDMSDIFKDDNNWYVNEAELSGSYPELACFATVSPDASHVSALMIMLPSSELPIQRAESITKNFMLSTTYEGSWWSSPDNNIVKINNISAQVIRPCSTRPIVITAHYNDSYRGFLLQIKGFDAFNAGVIGGDKRACHGDGIKFSDRKNGGEVQDAIGGRDDDKKAYPYYYRIEQYQLLDFNNDGEYEDTVFFKSYEMTSDEYKDWLCDTEHDGHWVYRRYVHDSQCQLEYMPSIGEFYLTVFSGFDAGEIETKTDTVYGNYPTAIHVNSVVDATGGEGPYFYKWYYTKMNINYLTGDTTILADSTEYVKENLAEAVLDTILDATGEYFFYRSARDLYCNNINHTPSDGVRHYIVFDYLNAGAIAADTINICLGDALPDIAELASPTGGNGIYSYRWLVNEELIPNADSSALSTDVIPFVAGQTYNIIRQVKDNTGLMDWTDSEGKFVVHVYRTFNAGRIRSDSITACLDTDIVRIAVKADNQVYAQGDGTINYRWQIFDMSNNHLIITLDNNQASLSDSVSLDINIPSLIHIVRQGQNPICSDTWVDSEGSAIIAIGRNKTIEQDIVLCREDLPYNGIYEFSGGTTGTYQFAADGEIATLTGINSTGCKETVILTCHITDVPEAEINPIGVVCQTDTVINIYYTITNGNPNKYLITYNEAGYEAGLKDATGSLAADQNSIIVPIGIVPLGEFEMYVRFIEQGAESGCKSDIDTLSFSVNLGGFVHQKWYDVLFIDNNDKNGFPDAEHDLQFGHYQWYKDGELIEGAIEQVYAEQGGLNGVYYAILTDINGNRYKTCPVEARPTGLDSNNILTVCPTIVNAGEKITIQTPMQGQIQIIATNGQTIRSENTLSTLTTPSQSGIFLLRMITIQGESFTTRIIVK